MFRTERTLFPFFPQLLPLIANGPANGRFTGVYCKSSSLCPRLVARAQRSGQTGAKMKTTQAYCNLIAAVGKGLHTITLSKRAAAFFLLVGAAGSLVAQALTGEGLSISPQALTARSYTVDLE